MSKHPNAPLKYLLEIELFCFDGVDAFIAVLRQNRVRSSEEQSRLTCPSLGVRPLVEQCAELEQHRRGGSVADAASRVTAIEASYRKVEAAVAPKVAIPPTWLSDFNGINRSCDDSCGGVRLGRAGRDRPALRGR